MSKSIILSNETPNDKGWIVKSKTLNLSRFLSNPVMLYNHGYDPELLDTPIGHWTNIRFEGKNLVAEPVFSSIYKTNSKVGEIKTLWDEGNLKAASIGCFLVGETTGQFKTNEKGQRVPIYKTNEDGFVESTYGELYEASIVPMPSNETCLQLSAQIFEFETIEELNSNYIQMAKKQDGTDQAPEPAAEPVNTEQATDTPPQPEPAKPVEHIETVFLKHEDSIVEKLTTALTAGFEKLKEAFTSGPKHTEPDGDEPPAAQKDPEPTDQVHPKNEAELNAEACNPKPIKTEAEYEAEISKMENEAELEAMLGAELPEPVRSLVEKKLEAIRKPKNAQPVKLNNQINMTELNKSENLETLRADASVKVGQVKESRIPTFTQLRSDEKDNSINQVLESKGNELNYAPHLLVLESLMKDSRVYDASERKAGVLNKISLNYGGSERVSIEQYMSKMRNQGISYNTTFGARKYMELGSTDTLLSSPDLNMASWLTMVFLKLYPSKSWRSNIPMFGAESAAGTNKGFIWANIAIDPTIASTSAIGSSVLDVDDTPVSLTLREFYCQPALWKPLQMQTLNYDKMSMQWAQMGNKFFSEIDNYYILSLLQQIYASTNKGVVKTSGTNINVGSGYNDSFKLNPAFSNSVGKPQLTDIARMEQIFINQNFPDGTEFVAPLDAIAEFYLQTDNLTLSKLTEFKGVDANGGRVQSFKNGQMPVRSQFGLYDTVTDAIIDPAAVSIPSTAVSAMPFFVPDQVGTAISVLNVFMIQDPTTYGFKMSMDARAGAAIMRDNGVGTGIYYYGDAQV